MAKKNKLGLFLGTFVHEVAEGQRISLPSRFRVELSENQIVLAKSPEGSLLGFDGKDFLKNSQKILEQSIFEPNAAEPRRRIFTSSVAVDIDDHGRFVIPEELRQWAGIKTNVVLAGLGDSFEVWAMERYPQRLALKRGGGGDNS
jgi:MraZ protein